MLIYDRISAGAVVKNFCDNKSTAEFSRSATKSPLHMNGRLKRVIFPSILKKFRRKKSNQVALLSCISCIFTAYNILMSLMAACIVIQKNFSVLRT